jgi:hypothetical protein
VWQTRPAEESHPPCWGRLGTWGSPRPSQGPRNPRVRVLSNRGGIVLRPGAVGEGDSGSSACPSPAVPGIPLGFLPSAATGSPGCRLRDLLPRLDLNSRVGCCLGGVARIPDTSPALFSQSQSWRWQGFIPPSKHSNQTDASPASSWWPSVLALTNFYPWSSNFSSSFKWLHPT